MERNTDTYQFVYDVAVELWNTPILFNKGKPIYDTNKICALKAIKLCTVPNCGRSFGITDNEIHCMTELLEEDLNKLQRKENKK